MTDLENKIQKLAEKAYLIWKGEVRLTRDEWVEWPLTESEIQYLREKVDLDLTGYVRMVSVYDIIHVFNSHGDRYKEAARGQVHVIIDDFRLIPFILDKGEAIDFGTDKQGLNFVKYRADLQNKYFYVEIIRTGRKKLALKSMFKRK